MTSTAHSSSAAPGPGQGHGLLGVVRECAQAEAEAARAKLAAVVAWAAAHPGPREEDLPAGVLYADREVELAGPGAPGVSEFAVVELAAALGKSPGAGKRFLGDALELGYRLPAIWARVVAGELEEWKARGIAQRTKQLSAPAAAWVDAAVAPRAHKLGPRQVDRLVEEAIACFDPDTAAGSAEAVYAQTYVHIVPGNGAVGGVHDLAQIQARIPLADALALDRALTTTAHHLLDTYPDHDLDERRALALGRLADHTLTGTGERPARQVNLVVHLDQGRLKDAALARVHTATGEQHLVTVEAVATWCLHPGTKVTIRPVIDLATPLTCPGYTPSPALREQITMLCPTCAFPHCTTPAERCDLDHIVPWAAGGQTSTWNLAPLCRLHHRLKTHGDWTYTQPRLGTYHWTSTDGHRYQRDRDGTTTLTTTTLTSTTRTGHLTGRLPGTSSGAGGTDPPPTG